MRTLQDLLSRLWYDYRGMNPQAEAIHRLLKGRGETILNDHVAFRTFAHPRLDIESLAAPFIDFGYRQAGHYDFPEKQLDALHYEHPDLSQPKIFISQLHMDRLSAGARSILLGLINQIPADLHARWDFCLAGRPWNLDFAGYEALGRESEYAAWLSAFGFRANHFTVFANALGTFSTLGALNVFLKANGFRLNDIDGEIKGTPEQYLEQSSTMASRVSVDFLDGTHTVPGCYYEFARRYPMPDGRLFQGFNARSANRIFESTDRK